MVGLKSQCIINSGEIVINYNMISPNMYLHCTSCLVITALLQGSGGGGEEARRHHHRPVMGVQRSQDGTEDRKQEDKLQIGPEGSYR